MIENPIPPKAYLEKTEFNHLLVMQIIPKSECNIECWSNVAEKFLFFAAVVAVAQAGLIAQPAYSGYSGLSGLSGYSGIGSPLSYSAPVAKIAAPLAYASPVVKSIDADYDPNPQYSYSYEVQDQLTGDSKSQQETRSGDVVQGSYSLVEPDGTKRIVEYTADPHNGFNAVVSRQPLAVKVAAPLAYAAPVAKIAAPLAYSAPIAKIASPLAYSSPVARIASPLGYSSQINKIASPLSYSSSAYY
ncbi:cuticle protein-like [Arctopsyche grandis]|uniref:cuticle protein-like n=1 Tax=Arctopsyche grandis TaxID=121162 RepID=UPI00406D7CDB